ncbi:MAG: Cof-type HAD-IIB family hydrolase [Candidatus Paralactobacillus gallistercoris]|uniref:Cof-type HAD-IIB family hydrolase n=1 Tax=Candidatus Paralactobacillus gallistercoris TaxID=2838724 RepID=A0A948TIR2_9LACO|nr:Cof-type HAD-IIB family hydrolase [Candidatus Paralactobacillus gallistercoris]
MNLIALDLDGTTLNAAGKLTPLTIKTLQTLQAMGHKVVITTGRPDNISVAFYDELQLTTPMINFDGALITIPHQQWAAAQEVTLDDAVITDLLTLKEQYQLKLVVAEGKNFLLSDRPFTNVPYLVDNPHPDTLLSAQTLPRRPISLTIFAAKDTLHEITRVISNKYPQLLINSWGAWLDKAIEITTQAAYKSRAVQYVANYYHLPMTAVLAFGDDDNDVDMLKDAGLGVAMKNGNAHAKAAAQQQTSLTNDEDGVAHFLIDYFKLDL